MQQEDSGTLAISVGALGTTFTIAGLAFLPKAIYFSWSGRATVGQSEATSRFGHGIAVSTSSRRAYSQMSLHGISTSVCWHVRHDNGCIAVLHTDGTLNGRADLDEITSDGFRLIIDVAFTTALQVQWRAVGGSDITDVEIVDFTEPAVTGDLDVPTGFALDTGLNDKAVIILGMAAGVMNAASSHAFFSLGLVAGNTPVNAVVSTRDDTGAATSTTYGFGRKGQCIASLRSSGVTSNASVTAWLSNGFRLNYTEVDGSQTWGGSALVIKGGRWEVGDNLTSTGTSNQEEPTTYIPHGLIVMSACRAESAADTTSVHAEASVGIATSVAKQSYATFLSENGEVTAQDVGIAFNTGQFYGNQNTGANIAIEGTMGLVSFDRSTPGFTYAHADADPSQNWFAYLSGATSWIPVASMSGSSTTPDIQQTIGRALIAAPAGQSSTQNAVALLLRSLLAAISGVSATPDAVAIFSRILATAISGSSTTADIQRTIERAVVAALTGASSAADASALLSRALLVALSGASLTTTIDQVSERAILADIGGQSITADISITISGLLELFSVITGISITQDVSGTIARSVEASVTGQSTTNDIVAAVLREIAANIPGISVTSDLTAILILLLTATISGVSITPDLAAVLIRALMANIAGASQTADITVQIIRVIQLLAAIVGVSLTSGATATSARSVISAITGDSQTAIVASTMGRALLASISGSSTTPSVIPTMLGNLISMIASVAGISVTPDISRNIGRTLSALLVGQSSTTNVHASVARMLLADIAGTSVTPDDLVIIMAALIDIVDVSFESLTEQRKIISLTPERRIESKEV